VKQQDKPCQVEAWLEALGAPSADRDYKPGHARLLALVEAIKAQGFSFHKPKIRIRIAGTNGKGSTANFLAQALVAQGFNVGLYTSPHIQTFHERICVNQQTIPHDSLHTLMMQVMPLALEIGTSYFETATVLALMYFSQEKVDVEILEAGVGAKLDATTAVPADIALLTAIGLDHQAWLGDTVEAITREKAYVFKGCSIKLSLMQQAQVKQVLDEVAGDVVYTEPLAEPLQMLGEHQKHNAGLAFAALDAMALSMPALNMAQAKASITSASIAGRLEVVQFQGHTFILDAAHNEHAIQALMPTLQAMPQFDVVFLATREDRDLSHCVDQLALYADKVVVMTGEQPYIYPSLSDALDAEVQRYIQGRFLVLGSFLTLHESLSWFKSGKKYS